MEILTACLCDSAADYHGKLCVLGAFDTIWALQFPCTHPQCSVAIRLLLRDEDVGDHTIRAVFINADAVSLIPHDRLPQIGFAMNVLPPDVYFASQNFVFNFQGLPVPAPGQYEIGIEVDNRTIQTIPFQFVQQQV